MVPKIKGGLNLSLWLVVDLEHEELPQFVGFSAQEAADWAGTTKESVKTSIIHAKERGARCRFVRVALDEDDEFVTEAFDGKLFGTKEIAKRIGIAATTFRRHKDEMPVQSWNGTLVADEEELDAWMQDPPEWLVNCWKKREEKAK